MMSRWKRLLEEESEHQWISFAVFAIFIIFGGVMIDWSNELSGVREGATLSSDGVVYDIAGNAVLNMQDNGMHIDIGEYSTQKDYATCLTKYEHITFACFGEEGLIHFHEDNWPSGNSWAAMDIGQGYVITDISANNNALLLIVRNGMTHTFSGFWINGQQIASNTSQISEDITINSIVPTNEGWLAGGAIYLDGNPASPPKYELVIEIIWDGTNKAPVTEIVHIGGEGEIHTMLNGEDDTYFAAGNTDTVRIDDSGVNSIGFPSTAAAIDNNHDLWLFGEIGSSTVVVVNENGKEIETLPEPLPISATYASIDDSGVISLHGIDTNDSPSAISIDPEERLSFTSLRGTFDLVFIFISLLILGMMSWNIFDALKKGEVF